MIYCNRCNTWFNNNHDYHLHRRNSPLNFICWSCNIDFQDWGGLEEHYRRSPMHFYCPSCQKLYTSQNALDNVRPPQVPSNYRTSSSLASQFVYSPPEERPLPDERVRAIFHIPRRSRPSSRGWFLHIGHGQVPVRPAHPAVRQEPPYHRSIAAYH